MNFTGFYKFATNKIIWYAHEGIINGPAFDGVDYYNEIVFERGGYYQRAIGERAGQRCSLWIES